MLRNLGLLEKKRVLSRLRPCTLLHKENHRLLPSRYPVLHSGHLFIANFAFIIANRNLSNV